MVNRAIASVRAYTFVYRTDETVVLCVRVNMSPEDMILSHGSIYVYVVSLITKNYLFL